MKRLPYLLTIVLTILALMFFSSISQAQTSFNISNKTNGDTLLTIDNDGNMGIGLQLPEARLDIQRFGSGFWQRGIRLLNPDLVTGNQLLLSIGRSDDANNVGNLYFTYDADGSEFNRLSLGLYAVNDVLNILANGRVGIGTTNPTAKFTISGSSASLNHGESAIFIQNSNRYFDFNGGMIFRGSGMNWNSRFTATDNLGTNEEVVGIYKHEVTAGDVLNDVTEVIATFKNNGNVGIGLTNPDQGLVVADTIRSTVGGFQFPDGSVQETAAGAGLGNTLDQAYDQGGAGEGRDITADNGSVRIFGNDGLYVQGDINTSGSVHSGGSLFLYGSGSEGGQISLRDGDDDGGWIIDNYGNSNSESIRIFNPDGATPVFNALVINELGNVGIGTGGPSADLHVDGTDGILFGGTFGSGTIPAEGASTRMMWYPAKAAFRAGQVESEYFWDDDSVGSHSTAFGKNTRASGTASIAIGNVARAQGDNSVALGYFNMASGNSSLAMGRIAVASGSNSSAMGYTTTASGNYSIAAGFESTASGHWSTAIGNNTEAIGDNSFAIGQNSTSSGQVSTAMGFYTNSTGSASTSLGSATTASGNMSLAAGLSTTASGNYSVALGRHIEAAGEGSIAIGLQDMGDIQVTQDSTMAIMGGKVGIGTTAPTEMLEVADTIYSSIGGFKFPDQTVQTTAATGGGAGNTLDQAYDEGGVGAGRIITADNGAVNIQGDDGLMVSGNVGIGMVLPPTYPLVVYPETNTRGLYIGHGQTGPGETQSIYVDLTKSYSGDSDVYGAEIQTTNNNGTGSTNGIYAKADGSATGIKAGVQGRAEGPGLNFGVHGSVFGDGATASQIGVYGHATGSGNLLAGYFDGGNVYIRNRLGIGTTTPNAGLHLHGTGFPSSFMYLSSETGGSAGFRLYEGTTAKWHIFNSYQLDGLQIYNDNGQTVFYADQTTGYVGIGTTTPTSKLDVRGNVTVRDESSGDIVIELGTGLDYAEGFDVSDKNDIGPGTVLCIDENNPGNLKISERPYDYKVAGIVAGANELGSGVTLGSGQHDFNVALAGRVYCNVDASNEAVKAGDLLTTSDLRGYAQKVTDYQKSQGAILGKAMQNLEKSKKGQILVLVTLQ